MSLGAHELGLTFAAVLSVLALRASVSAFQARSRVAAKRVLLWGVGFGMSGTVGFVAAMAPVFGVVTAEAPQTSALLVEGASGPVSALLATWFVAALLLVAGTAAWLRARA